MRKEWAQRVVDEAGVGPGDLILDLGAGTGALTAPLIAAGARVLAIELHPVRAALLRERFGDRLTVIQTDLRELRLPYRPFKVVANPPYHLTTGLVRRLLGSDRMLSADLVLQRGAMRGLVAAPPRAAHSRRYVLSQGMVLPAGAYRSPPPVESSVLRIRRR
ncbi:MAG: methyltransferase domain-containing protein [Actinomycetota bacterium]|nr:methyltransferase domain-containing protein [Actinomycetota bacterium]